jgi:hypothetical protein
MDLRSETRPLVALLEDNADLQFQLLAGLFAVKPSMDDADSVIFVLVMSSFTYVCT